MARRRSIEAALVKRCAKELGYTTRHITRLKNAQDPKWMDWLAADREKHKGRHPEEVQQELKEELQAKAEAAAALPKLTEEEEELAMAQENVQVAYEALRRLRDYSRTVENTELPAATRAIRDAQKAWYEACDRRADVKERAKAVIPVENVREIQRILITKLGNALNDYPRKVAAHFPVDMRPQLEAAHKAERRTMAATLTEIDKELEKLLNNA